MMISFDSKIWHHIYYALKRLHHICFQTFACWCVTSVCIHATEHLHEHGIGVSFNPPADPPGCSNPPADPPGCINQCVSKTAMHLAIEAQGLVIGHKAGLHWTCTHTHVHL